ncbi:MAG: UDP-N-acetylglucosamine 2-epimerase (hydrolyzing) [bacterium (Candidatus Stahlbacteria) CG23_combo_of_CG06-09_8_20_14_all_34_7]|nr:MAG: UDP-N-acetylglucosamine 2-epimerase (hydrolyzing) [bacterium (Candidatus Stahlbacteria) CG23_combo_of_CG06-09_8_20_14_all_34_7]
MKTNILILSTNRSDYSHLYLTIKALKQSKLINAIFVATGGHFDRERGSSLNEIYDTGIKPDYKISTVIDWESEAKIFASIISFEKKLRTLIKMVKADYIMVLGDRIELLAVINLSLIMKKKIIHISGGETTLGAVDDYVRKMLSLISYIHFVSGDYFKENLKNFLKTSKDIINAGDPILEYIDKTEHLTLNELNKDLGLNLLEKKYILFTYHPETNSSLDVKVQFQGLEKFLSEIKINVICTSPNSDLGGDYIIKRLKHISNVNKNVFLTMHLGFKRYNALMKNSLCGMGNSSSLVIECPYLNVPSIVIGSRQKGRPLSESVINTSHEYKEILSAFNNLYSNFPKKDNMKNQMYYERAETSLIIKETIEKLLC